MRKSEPPRIAVIGAGPIGLEAALYAKSLGLPVTVYERGEVGEHLSRWGHVKLFTPFALNHTPLAIDAIRKDHPQHALPGPNDLLTGNDYRDQYLMPLTLTSLLCDCVRMKTEVLFIGRANVLKTDPANDSKRATAPFRILTRNDQQQERVEEADVILDCSGNYRRHRWLGEGGIPAVGEIAAEKNIAYGLEDILGKRQSHYAGKSVLVVGGGYSAATSIVALATLAEQNSATWIVWLNRGSRSTPLQRYSSDPLRERDRLAARANTLANRGEGHVEYHGNVSIDEIQSHGSDRGFRVVAHSNHEELSWEVERIIANVGHAPDLSFARELHVIEPGQSIRQPEPNYFILGVKSFGRDSSFLLRTGHEQVRDVFAQITGKPKLDLYQGKLSGPIRLAG